MLASPVFRCVKKQMNDVEVHFLTKYAYRIVSASNPYIDKFYYYDENMPQLREQLKKENYDFVIDLHNNIRSYKIKKYLKAETYTIDKLTLEKFLLTNLNIDFMPNRHIAQRSLDAVLSLGVQNDGGGLDYFIDKNDEVKIDDIPTGHLAGFIAIVIGATHFTKRFPTHKIIELCSKIDHPIILLGGKEDAENGAIIANKQGLKIYNACGKFNISESADIVRKAKLVISNDTGMQYIACAFKRPVLALWGGTTPDLDVEPYYGKNFMSNIQKPIYENVVLNLSCQPCSKYGLKSCPKEHFNCMEKIDVDQLVMKVKAFL